MYRSFFATDHFFASQMPSFGDVWNFPSFEFSVRNATLACMLVGGRWTEPKSPTYISASNEKRSFKITFAFKVDTEKNIKRSYSLNKSTFYCFLPLNCWSEGVYLVEFKLNWSTINTKNRIQFQRKQNESDLFFWINQKHWGISPSAGNHIIFQACHFFPIYCK